MHSGGPAGARRARPALSTRDAAIGLVCIAIIIVGFAAIFRACGGGGEPDWDHPVFWVLHNQGTLKVIDLDASPGEAPEGDEWVRPVIYRCLKDGTEFVAYHTRTAMTDEETFPVEQVALPGGPWVSEGDPESWRIARGPTCPTCGAGLERLEGVTPQTARSIWPPED